MVKVLLIVVQGKPEGKTIPISSNVFRIGRGEDCHLRPNSEEVSRRHTEIVIEGSVVTVRDLGSRNGTRINGKLLSEPHVLKSGELLQIGPLTFAVAIQGAPAEQAQPAPAQPAAAATSPAKAPSLDDVPPDQIDAWLVSDNARPTPDRPSGVYDGETLTIDAYREASGSKPPSSHAMPASKPPSSQAVPTAKPSSSQAVPTAKPPSSEAMPTAKPKSSPSIPARPLVEPEPESPFDAVLEGIEHLPEGVGDGEEAAAAAGENGIGEEGEADTGGNLPDEMMDENNPFYAAKKAGAEGKGSGEATAVKKSFKDTSDAASDILRRMLERRRGDRP